MGRTALSVETNVVPNSADWNYTAANSAAHANEFSFKTITLSANRASAATGADIVADSTTDTLTLCAGPNIELISEPGSDVITMQTQDLDGDGPNEPVITVSGPLTAGTSYAGSIQWLNEMEDPAEDITEEILEEDDEHQVFFSAAGVGMEFVYMDFDGDGNPLGTQFVLAPLGAGSGSVTITLVHEPAKPNDGLDTAGGSIDIQTTFPVTVE